MNRRASGPGRGAQGPAPPAVTDIEAFIGPHRLELRALCYRMLGSVEDADDAMQEVWLRAWRGLPVFEGRSSPRTWLFRIATNVCLSKLERAPARTVPLDAGPPAPTGSAPGPMVDEPWLGPYPDRFLADERSSPDVAVVRMESMELAFVSALHALAPRGRAVLMLRAVLECSAQETAELLGMSVPAVNSALQRARSTIRSRAPMPSQQEVVRELGDRRLRALVARYTRAMETADVAAVLELLDADATWTMPPMATWYRGKPAIEAFLRDFAMQERWRHLVTSANGQPAVGCYLWDPGAGAYLAYVLDVLTIRGDRIAAVNAFVDARAVTMCGLPDRIEA